MRSKEHELKELEDRIKELDVQRTANDEEASAAEATRAATLEVTIPCREALLRKSSVQAIRETASAD